MIQFYISHSENLIHFKFKLLHKSILIIVAKTCKKVLSLNMTSTTKEKVANCHLQLRSHITKQLLTSISVDIMK